MQRWLVALTALVLLSACANAAGTALLFQDSFDDARNGWTLTSNTLAEINISNGQLLIAIDKPDALAWTIAAGNAAGKSFDNFSLDIDVTPVAGPDDNDYGVIIRHVDDNNFYRFEISGDGYYNIQKRAKGKWERLVPDWTPSAAIRTGKATNHLQVVCAGTLMTFFANQVKLTQVNDAAFTRGGIGLFAGTLAQPGVQVVFDNLKVSR